MKQNYQDHIQFLKMKKHMSNIIDSPKSHTSIDSPHRLNDNHLPRSNSIHSNPDLMGEKKKT